MRLGVDVDGVDGAAGQHVVELIEQQQLPQPVELRARVAVGDVTAEAGDDGQRLDTLQQALAAPVPVLRLCACAYSNCTSIYTTGLYRNCGYRASVHAASFIHQVRL